MQTGLMSAKQLEPLQWLLHAKSSLIIVLLLLVIYFIFA